MIEIAEWRGFVRKSIDSDIGDYSLICEDVRIEGFMVYGWDEKCYFMCVFLLLKY